jgi:uncharacterized protein (DUF58 family)
VSARRRTFPLLSRPRLIGTPFGESRSSRRGRGSDVSGTRPYVPGDPVSTIDWYASARLSAAHGSDEFVVRELYREESPRVMIVVDRRPSMALYDRGFPWLSKPSAVAAAAEAIAFAAVAARAELGYAEEDGGRTRVLSPGAVAPRYILDRARRASFAAGAASLRRTLTGVAARRAEVPQSSFVFVLSDFLDDVPAGTWTLLRRARLDVVPVIVQDPTWEQSFPPVQGVLVPFAGLDGVESSVRLTAAECSRFAGENEQRLDRLSARFRMLGFDPIVLGTSDPAEVDGAFLRWAERRRRRRRRR